MSASTASVCTDASHPDTSGLKKLPANEAARLLSKLRAGSPPAAGMALATLAGFDRLLGEWKNDLDGYVRHGGSLLRVLSAPVGAGKTHLARAVQALAAERRFLVCQVDAAAQHTDDDLALLEAFSDGLTDADALLEEDAESGLLSILERAAAEVDPANVKGALRRAGVPVSAVADVLPDIVMALSPGRLTKATADDVDTTVRILSGHLVENTRSVARLRKAHPGPLLRKLGRAPGKRDARLWLESLLKAIPALGYSGVLWILDEHDEASRRVMDRHIVQLRRLADRLAEGRLPGALVVYLVLDDFPSRIRDAHGALDQRLRPVLAGAVPGRVMVPLANVRDVDPPEFLCRVARRTYALVCGGQMPPEVVAVVEGMVRKHSLLGGVNTRGFVQEFSTHLYAKSFQ